MIISFNSSWNNFLDIVDKIKEIPILKQQYKLVQYKNWNKPTAMQ